MTKLFAAFVAACALAACGGGGGVPEAPVAPAPLPTLPVVVSDVTMEQIDTVTAVTPGETFRAVLAKVTCPQIAPDAPCMNSVLLGQTGFDTDLELYDVKAFHDGVAVEGNVEHDGSRYRFTPFSSHQMWRPGSFEFTAVLSPTAKDGVKSRVTFRAADASIDKKLTVVSGSAAVEVFALPAHAPAVITMQNDKAHGVTGLKYDCPVSVSGGCHFEGFDLTAAGVSGSEVDLYVANKLYSQMWSDVYGYISTPLNVGAWLPPGGSVTVMITAVVDPKVFSWTQLQNFRSWSGNMEIAPVLSAECLAGVRVCQG